MKRVNSEDAVSYMPDDVQPLMDEELRVLAQAARILRRLVERGPVMESPTTVRDWLRHEIGAEPSEAFAVMYMDSRLRMIAFEPLFSGTIDAAEVHMREIVRRCLRHNAAAVIVAHNHPSGNPEPSRADRLLTERIKEALKLIDVRLVDHIVVAPTGTKSFAEMGWI